VTLPPHDPRAAAPTIQTAVRRTIFMIPRSPWHPTRAG
jgi:hypothetical protein